MLSILKKLEKFFIAFLKWFLSWQTKNITTFPSPYRLTATPRTEEIKNKNNWWLRQAQPPIIPLHVAWACRRHILIPPGVFDSAQSPV